MSELHIATDLALPDNAVTRRLAILAGVGAGKTYTALVLGEEFLKAAIPVVIIDPLGVCWGLRSSADGKSPGLPIVVMGGDHGDVELGSKDGEKVADLVVELQLSVVLDLGNFSGGEQRRFFTDFAERLFHISRRAVHLIIDEADIFAPQRPQPGEQRMLGAAEKLVRRGRVKGIGLTLITQRAAVLNKNVLNLVECLILGRMAAPTDRKSVESWIEAHSTQENRDEVLGSLATMDTRKKWIWGPHWPGVLQLVEIRQRETFDSSATPELGEEIRVPQSFATVDLARLREVMSAPAEEDGGADRTERTERTPADTAPLQRRISELEAEVKQLRARPEPKPVVNAEQLRALHHQALLVQDSTSHLYAGLGALERMFCDAIRGIEPAAPGPAAGDGRDERDRKDIKDPDPVQIAVQSCPGVALVKPPVRVVGRTAAIAKGPRRMLEALARRSPVPVTRAQLGRLAKLTHSGGTFGGYLSELKSKDYVHERNGQLRITDEGMAALGTTAPARPSSTRELQAWWRSSFSNAEWRVMQQLIEVHPRGLDRKELARRAGLTHTGGTFGGYIGVLKTAGLIDERGGRLHAVTEQLFVEGGGNGG